LPGGINKDAQPVPSLQILGTGHIAIEGEIFYLTVGNQTYTVDLHARSVAQLAQAIADTGVTYFVSTTDGSVLSTAAQPTVLQNGIAGLLSLPNGATSAYLPTTLQIPSNPLYFIIGMMARMLESRRRSAQSQAAQVNLQAAFAAQLDWWGANLGLSRYQGEPDTLYSQRITAMRFRPVQNGIALEDLLATLGYTATITDSAYGSFLVNITIPQSPPQGFIYSLAQLQDVIDRTKAGAVYANVEAQATLADSMAVTDSVSAILNAAPPTWGTSVWGQFNWQGAS
jgi:hypothetical protein